MISCTFECGKSFFSSDLCAGKVSISLPVYISLPFGHAEERVEHGYDASAGRLQYLVNLLSRNF